MTFVIIVPVSEVDSMMYRLDSLKNEKATHYSVPVLPVNPDTYPFNAFFVDERAQSVLTPKEWDSRLTSMPIEFLHPNG